MDSEQVTETEATAEQAPVTETAAPTEQDRIIAQIIELNHTVREKDLIVGDLKEQLKDAKEDYESAVRRLTSLIDSLTNDQDRPLLAVMEGAEAAPEAWRTATIAALGLPPKIEEKLAEVDVTTVGALEDLRAKIADGKAEWPKGIGVQKITLIEDAVLNWLTENRTTWSVPVETVDGTQLSIVAGDQEPAQETQSA